MPIDLPSGASCWIDANVLYYTYVETPQVSGHCRELLRRTQAGEVEGYCNTRCVTDAIHKIMLAEIAQRHGRGRDKLIGWLKQNPAALAALPRTAEAGAKIARLRLTVLPVAMELMVEAVAIAQQQQLLFNDAMTVALIRWHGMEYIATNDDDFDRASGRADVGFKVWKPR